MWTYRWNDEMIPNCIKQFNEPQRQNGASQTVHEPIFTDDEKSKESIV